MSNRRRSLALALCAALGCGAPSGATRPTALAGTRHYPPLAMKADAQRPDQAVILGTDDTNGSTVLPLAATVHVVVVDAMVARHDGARISGDTISITLTAAPNQPAEPRAETAAAGGPGLPAAQEPSAPAVYGALPSGSSEGAAARWSAGLWSAAMAAASALGKDIDDLAFSAMPAGAPDGIASSALLSAGFVATLTGANVDPAATLAGAINPDGTLAPVAGVPEHFLAAIAHGKTRLGYPSGLRVARSLNGKDVDLVQLARAHHAEAVELAGLPDAYRLLTRRALPAPVPVREADMALDPDTLRTLDAGYLATQKLLAEHWAPLLALEQAGRLPPPIAAMARAAKDAGAAAEALHRAGKPAAAHARIAAARVYAAAATQTFGLVGRLQAGDVEGGIAALTALAPSDASLDELFTRIAATRPASLAGHLRMLTGFQAALRAWSYRAGARDTLRDTLELLGALRGKSPADLGAPATADSVAGAVAPAVLMLLRAAAEADHADQALALTPDRGIAYTCAPATLTRLAAATQAATGALLGHLDASLVEPLARSASISADQARHRVAQVESDYLIAAALARAPADSLPRELAASWGEASVAGSLLALAGQELAFERAALVVARHDALSLRTGADGSLAAVEPTEAFRELLFRADRTARASARAARIATGEIPV
ncbi:MAG TPA: hypothetical protein VFT22_25945, partial [Kofleriaceae bacterium]|nr:hypothetical protein [Kofleriaceae bacterium]